MPTYRKNWLKLTLGFLACLFFRLLPFRTPNVEPILTTTMPFSKAYGAAVGFFFAFLSIIVYDVVTGTLGTWTLLTSLTYGVIGLASAYYFKEKEPTAKNFVIFAIVSTIFFDAITGLLTGPLFFHQSFVAAAIGQIPFTALHLLGNTLFAFILSPAIYSFAIKKKEKKKTDPLPLISILNPKII